MTPDEMMFYVPRMGVVVDNKDPEGIHRVRARIPGIMAQTPWAMPRTGGGGGKDWGGSTVPPVGCNVLVEWLNGNPETPLYSGAPWGRGELPGQPSPNAELVHVFQLGPLRFTIDLRPRDDDAGTGQRAIVEDVDAGTVLVEYDIARQGLTLEADYAVIIKAAGFIQATAGGQLQLNGRLVRMGTSKMI